MRDDQFAGSKPGLIQLLKPAKLAANAAAPWFAPQDGSIIRREKISGQADLAPVVADNTLLILTKDGALTAYR